MLDIDNLLDAGFGRVSAESDNQVPVIPDIVDWATEHFYVIETKRPIVLQPVQIAVLREFFRQGEDGRFVYRSGLYSTIKKSGKTTIAALVMRWAAETWGEYKEIFHVGNKLTQARDRAFKIVKHSIEISPTRHEWDITATTLTHIPTNNVIKALPVNAAGEAGSNHCLVTFTELHGYVHEESERFYSELQPVPTQLLSFRFLESYAGYEGESNLLKMVWDKGIAGQRVNDEYPLYATADGLIAYIDTGVEARRMPWQTPEYYRQAEGEELPHEFERIHMNKWSTSRGRLFDIALWDRLESNPAARPGANVIISVDASVSGDCSAISVTGYDARADMVIEYETYIFTPPKGGVLDYDETLIPTLIGLFKRYRVLEVAYDPYQLHAVMTSLSKRFRTIPFFPFPQGGERIKADSALLTRIRQGDFQHSGNGEVRQHVQNADGEQSGESGIRIVKRESSKPIDALVAISMGAWRWHAVKVAPPPIQTRQIRTPFWGGT